MEFSLPCTIYRISFLLYCEQKIGPTLKIMSIYALLHPLAVAVLPAVAFPSVLEAPVVAAVRLAVAVALLIVVAADETVAVVLAKRRPSYLATAALAATVATPLDFEAATVDAARGLTANCTTSFLASNYGKTATPDPAVVPAAVAAAVPAAVAAAVAAAVDAVRSPKCEPNAGKIWA